MAQELKDKSESVKERLESEKGAVKRVGELTEVIASPIASLKELIEESEKGLGMQEKLSYLPEKGLTP